VRKEQPERIEKVVLISLARLSGIVAKRNAIEIEHAGRRLWSVVHDMFI
jgi:hypothetical protein